MKEIPELPAYFDDSPWDANLWHVWCDYCVRWHTHGAGGKGDDPMEYLGHRGAHCDWDDSPYWPTGYTLVWGGRWTDLTSEQRRYGPEGKEKWRQLRAQKRERERQRRRW